MTRLVWGALRHDRPAAAVTGHLAVAAVYCGAVGGVPENWLTVVALVGVSAARRGRASRLRTWLTGACTCGGSWRPTLCAVACCQVRRLFAPGFYPVGDVGRNHRAGLASCCQAVQKQDKRQHAADMEALHQCGFRLGVNVGSACRWQQLGGVVGKQALAQFAMAA